MTSPETIKPSAFQVPASEREIRLISSIFENYILHRAEYILAFKRAAGYIFACELGDAENNLRAHLYVLWPYWSIENASGEIVFSTSGEPDFDKLDRIFHSLRGQRITEFVLNERGDIDLMFGEFTFSWRKPEDLELEDEIEYWFVGIKDGFVLSFDPPGTFEIANW